MKTFVHQRTLKRAKNNPQFSKMVDYKAPKTCCCRNIEKPAETIRINVTGALENSQRFTTSKQTRLRKSHLQNNRKVVVSHYPQPPSSRAVWSWSRSSPVPSFLPQTWLANCCVHLSSPVWAMSEGLMQGLSVSRNSEWVGERGPVASTATNSCKAGYRLTDMKSFGKLGHFKATSIWKTLESHMQTQARHMIRQDLRKTLGFHLRLIPRLRASPSIEPIYKNTEMAIYFSAFLLLLLVCFCLFSIWAPGTKGNLGQNIT